MKCVFCGIQPEIFGRVLACCMVVILASGLSSRGGLRNLEYSVILYANSAPYFDIVNFYKLVILIIQRHP